MNHNIIGKPAVRPCWNCFSQSGVLYRSSMTAYHYEGSIWSEDDPNRPHELCESCWEDYFARWSDMWESYLYNAY